MKNRRGAKDKKDHPSSYQQKVLKPPSLIEMEVDFMITSAIMNAAY